MQSSIACVSVVSGGYTALNLAQLHYICGYLQQKSHQHTLWGYCWGFMLQMHLGWGLNTIITQIASHLQVKPESFLAFLGLRRGLAVLRSKVSLKQPRSKVLPGRHPPDLSRCHCWQGLGLPLPEPSPRDTASTENPHFHHSSFLLTTCLQDSSRKPPGEDGDDYNRAGDNLSAWEVKRSKWKNRFKGDLKQI